MYFYIDIYIYILKLFFNHNISLIGKGRIAEAEKSLCWLRGWVKPDAVQYELSMIRKSIALNEEKIRLKKNKKFYSFYVKRTFLLPYFIITVTFFFGNFGGMSTLQVHAVSLNNIIILHNNSLIPEKKKIFILYMLNKTGPNL